MLAQINDFIFDIKNTSYDKLKRTINYNYATHQRLGNFESHQAIGKYEEQQELTGTLIAKSQRQLKEFEQLAALKKPLVFTTNSSVKTIIILNDSAINFV